jgi:serine/threonine protein phosphatase 1
VNGQNGTERAHSLSVRVEASGWQEAPFDPAGEVVFAIGDVHGCADQLQALRAAIGSLARDACAPTRLVYLGDLIDRGPDSLGVLEQWASDARAHGVDRLDRLMGNHEMCMLLSVGGGPHASAARERWLGHHMGGSVVLAEMRARTGRLDAVLDRSLLDEAAGCTVSACLDAMGTHLRLGNLLLVHGGLRPGVDVDPWLSVPWTDFMAAEWAWIMADFLKWPHGFGGLKVVHGHTPPMRHHALTGQSDPHRFTQDRLCLDGGSSRNGIVVAAQIEQGRYRILRASGPAAASAGSTAA